MRKGYAQERGELLHPVIQHDPLFDARILRD